MISGDGQTQLTGQALSASLVVRVLTAAGAGVAGVTVTWEVATGAGLLSSTSTATGSEGNASTSWTLGPAAGSQTVTASVQGLTGSPITFTATAVAPVLAVVSGNNQTANAGAVLPQPLVVKVSGPGGGGIAGVTLSWAASAGGILSAANTTTDAQGQAQVTWTLGTSVGGQAVTVTGTGLTGSPLTFNATAASPATTISMVSGNNQSGTVNSVLGSPLVALVSQSGGGGVAGETVTWAVAPGAGSVSAASTVTNSSGNAQVNWTLGPTVGTQTVTATRTGLAGSPLTFSATAVSATKTQRFMAPNGNDANDGLTPSTPWKSFAKAFGTSGIQAGWELILLDGTYSEANGNGYISYLGTGSGQPPSGIDSTAAGQTVVRAQNVGGVTIVGGLFIGRSFRKDRYITMRGINFEGRSSLYNTHYITIRDCGFSDFSSSGGSVLGIGTNDHANGNSYNLIEDSWIWGSNRIIAITYRGSYNVWRRVVLRGDGCSTSSCTGSGNPNVGITVYESIYTSLQNVIVVDRILGGGSPYSDFAVAQHTSTQPHGENEWLGTVSINAPDGAYYFEPDQVSLVPAGRLRNCVAWNSAGAGINLARSGRHDVENCTVRVNGTSDGLRVAPDLSGTGSIVRNVVVTGNGRFGVNSSVQPSFVNVFGTWSSGTYNQTTCATGCRTTNPLADGTPASLRFPLRIEPGSALSGTGFGGGDYGANVVNRYGVDGTHWGEPGYNTLTSNPLWPWPNQALIKQRFCSGVTRGWCGTTKTLTEYIWDQLGNGLPPGISPVGPPRVR